MIPARMLTFGLFALGGILLCGCQQRPTALNHVSGKVLYHGTTLAEGLIVFTPDTTKGESGKIAYGTIANDGTYTLRTEGADGATAGWYRVTVASMAGSSTYGSSFLPEKYREPQCSLLQCEVKPNCDNHLDFNLD
jgi:hypothetical protein